MSRKPSSTIEEWPEIFRAEYEKAWQEYRCCRDCEHWGSGDEMDAPALLRGCADFSECVFVTLETYTCEDFKKNTRDD